MAGIIEPDTGATVLSSPCVQRQGLGALHVRVETAQPEQARRAALAGAHRDAARRAILADLDEGGFLIGCRGIGHRIGHRTVTRVSAAVCVSTHVPSTDANTAQGRPRRLRNDRLPSMWAALNISCRSTLLGVTKMSRI